MRPDITVIVIPTWILSTIVVGVGLQLLNTILTIFKEGQVQKREAARRKSKRYPYAFYQKAH